MNLRKITSLTALVSFLLLILNSVVLYIVPHGRIAYWADWRLLGLTKNEWSNQHIIIGTLFLLAIFLHIYYNWKPIVAYLKNKSRQLKIFTREFNIALVLTIICTFGAYIEAPPFSYVLDFSKSIKTSAVRTYGIPPYGRAELSTLKTFTSKVGLDLTQSMYLLKKVGVRVESDKQTIQEIAKLNKMSPQQVYAAMIPEEKPGAKKNLPDSPPKGFGKHSLDEICREYNINISRILRDFVDNNIKVKTSATIKEIASQNDISSKEVYAIIKNAAKKGP